MGYCRAGRVELSEEAIIQRLFRPDRLLSPIEHTSASDLRPAGVLIPLICQDGEWQVLFIRRTESLATHKGQVAFPGGGSEAVDENIESTALRETYEEVGIRQENIHILGRLDTLKTNSGFLVTPIVGAVQIPIQLKLQPEEVARAFTIPLSWLADASHQSNSR